MSYRTESLLDTQCQCGGFPEIMRVFFRGTEREGRICNICHPEELVTEYVIIARDLHNSTVYRMAIRGASQWGYMMEVIMTAMGIGQPVERKYPPTPSPARPTSWFRRVFG